MAKILIGETLGNYRVVSELGEGGIGVVYLAEHITFGKRFAIKSLSPTLIHVPHFRERFYREVTNQAVLDHPNILPFIDFFEKEGQFFLLMEYVDGQDLSRLGKARRGPLKEKDALSILRDVLRGLEFAHTKHIIHRDIKPSNILIDKSGIARIMDFGIAILVGAVGSPLYMSPEQIQHPGQLDLRTDIYSVGMVLYEMLAGDVPFHGETDFSVMEQQLHEPPPNLHRKNPEISEELAEIVLKAMAKNPAERFQDCTEFLQSLREQERQRSEEEVKRKGEKENRRHVDEEKNRAQQEAERRLESKEGQRTDDEGWDRDAVEAGRFFFSYARADSEFVLKLAADLRSTGTNLWLDQLDIPAGARWDRAVEEALHASPCLLVVLSPASVASNNVMDEVSFGLETDKRIVPILFKDCAVPFRLKRFQYIDFRVGYDDGFKRLVQALKPVDQLPTPPSVKLMPETRPSEIEGGESQPESASVNRRESNLTRKRQPFAVPPLVYGMIAAGLVLVILSLAIWLPKREETQPLEKQELPKETVASAPERKPEAQKEITVQPAVAVLAAPVPKKPECGTVIPKSSLSHGITFSWQPVKGASTYTAEVDCFGCSGYEKSWYSLAAGRPWHIRTGLGLRSPIYSTSSVEKLIREGGGIALRWRVWTVNQEGKEGAKSEWCQVAFSGNW